MILDVTTLLWSHCHTLKTSIFMLFSKQFEEWKVCKYGSDLRFNHINIWKIMKIILFLFQVVHKLMGF